MIKTVAENLTEVFRHTDIVCRYGGEEFVIVLPGAPAEDALHRAEALRARVARLDLRHEGQALGSITLSAGIASWPEMIADPNELLTQADQALYRAKQAGRNRVERAMKISIDDAFAGRRSEPILPLPAPPTPPPEDESP